MNIPYYDRCVNHALKLKGIAGDSFKDTTMRVYKREAINPKNLAKILSKDGIIIPTVNAALFSDNKHDMVATIVISINEKKNEVILYDPIADEEVASPFNEFEKAWITFNYSCTTAFRSDGHTYFPKLIDLNSITLPNGYEELREAIAENAHDTWASARQSEGWTYGPKRDDVKLETPDMVPYSDLPDSERQYDRVMAEDTLKLLIALGYNIVKA